MDRQFQAFSLQLAQVQSHVCTTTPLPLFFLDHPLNSGPDQPLRFKHKKPFALPVYTQSKAKPHHETDIRSHIMKQKYIISEAICITSVVSKKYDLRQSHLAIIPARNKIMYVTMSS